jgi:wyosine [tRNA(Phe)-imidazoG37] synthetase (radical SAM superfamily)
MSKRDYKYIFGPVPSWRLGRSLGIDPVSKGRKVCSFDCLYCQIGKTGFLTDERAVFIDSADIIEELNLLPPLEIDYITFSGAGEPTLAANLGEMIVSIKKIRKEKIAVISNSSLFDREDVRQDLRSADFVIAKLDAPTQEILTAVNQPVRTIDFERIVSGIQAFKKVFKGKLALQIMFIEQNKKAAQDIARIAQEIGPDEVQINTPLRPCRVKPLPESEIEKIEPYFKGLKTITVYKAERKKVQPLSDQETLKRRGKI